MFGLAGTGGEGGSLMGAWGSRGGQGVAVGETGQSGRGRKKLHGEGTTTYNTQHTPTKHGHHNYYTNLCLSFLN